MKNADFDFYAMSALILLIKFLLHLSSAINIIYIILYHDITIGFAHLLIFKMPKLSLILVANIFKI